MFSSLAQASLSPSEMTEAKNSIRDKIRASAGISTFEANREKLENLIDVKELAFTNGVLIRTLSEIDARSFQTGHLASDVWSGSIWHQYLGLTAMRYMWPEAAHADSWQEAWAFASRPGQSFFDIAMGGTDEERDNLGPAEKYDLLVGSSENDKKGILSKYEWAQGADSLQRYGKVPKWFGYCHGWAAASFSLPRPESTVEVPSADGTQMIRFYPHDLKALATVLWANALPPVRLIGTRCQTPKPLPHDKDGRIVDPTCQGVSPGTFHLALVNQIQGAHRVLLMDADYDIQVWNQPIVAYSYKYFNPETKKRGDKFAQSVIAIEQFSKDKFKKYRSKDARQIVGVEMQVEYGQGTKPNHNPLDSRRFDQTRKATYKYDLELDASGEVIGGEWYQVRHPGFLWAVPQGTIAVSDFESQAKGDWDPSQPVPVAWTLAAEKAGEKGQPLAKVVQKLIELSRRPHLETFRLSGRAVPSDRAN